MNTTPLPRSTPESAGVSASRVTEFCDALGAFGGVDSVMVLRHGAVIAERWWGAATPERPHILHSISKSFTSTAAGFAVTGGLLSLDDRVAELLADELPVDFEPAVRRITVRHLLTMTGGWDEEAMPQHERRLTSSWVTNILGKPLPHEPGSQFVYNSGSTYLVSAIIQKLTGERVVDYLRPRLFDPLGIGATAWPESPQGVTTGGWGLRLTTEDLARFGRFCLGEGSVDGVQLISADWMREATSFKVPNARPLNNPDWSLGYGYQFWRCQNGAFRGDGAHGQLCVMLPEQDAVVVVTADLEDMQGELDVIWRHLLPAFDSP